MNIEFNCQNFKKVSSDGLCLSEVSSDISSTNLYLQRSGKPIVPVVGEFHFSRYPNELWEDEIKKMKMGGVTVISTYLFWIFHEENEGVFDFSGDKNIRDFLKLCEKHSMLVLLRIGPWCHGEVIYGGFPKFIQLREDKRTSSPEYMEKVKNLYSAYYEQVKDFFYQNGSVVIGIQLENEYGGKDHEYITNLKKIAVDIGFKLPLYTITAWPPNVELKGDLLPMFGRYPERPWTQNTLPLPVDNRFHITSDKIDKGIGADILKDVVWENLCYDKFPYATCELGCGVQVYEHRRPIISHQDAYSIAFIHLAQGVNLLGYYMYHGGRNPIGCYQESRFTGYPNNCPISSYDFQAPISEYGYLRKSYYRLKLLHLFLSDYQEHFATTQAFFCKKCDNEIDYKTSLRVKPDGSGYVFINNYQRLVPYNEIKNANITINTPQSSQIIYNLNVPVDVSLMFPINMRYGNIKMKYLIAQPICYEKEEHVRKYYFFVPNGIKCRGYLCSETNSFTSNYKVNEEISIEPNTGVEPVLICESNGEKDEIYILTEDAANNLWKYHNHVFFSNADVVDADDKSYLIDKFITAPSEVNISLEEKKHELTEHDYYLFSKNPVKEYSLHIPKDIFSNYNDYRILFKFVGNVAQLYCGKTLMADCFNYNELWEISLKRFKKQIENGDDISIVVSAIDKDREIYFEHAMEVDKIELTIKEITPVIRQTISYI